MKIDRIIWGVLFLFIGGVILLDNFGVIEFYWRNVWQFWPVFLIIAGVNLLVGKKDSQLGGIVSVVVLVVALAFLFWKGQQPPERSWFGRNFTTKFNHRDWDDDKSKHTSMSFIEEMPATPPRVAELNFSGGGTSLVLEEDTDSLLYAEAKERYGNLQYDREITDSLAILNFTTKSRNKSWNVGSSGNDILIKINKTPEWKFNFKLGAGSLDMDVSNFKVKAFQFDGGASAMDVKLGDLLPMVNVNIKAGVSDVKLKIPTESGCQITTSLGMSMRDFRGFTKIREGVYETEGYSNAKNKIVVKFEGGLGNFEVDRY